VWGAIFRDAKVNSFYRDNPLPLSRTSGTTPIGLGTIPHGKKLRQKDSVKAISDPEERGEQGE